MAQPIVLGNNSWIIRPLTVAQVQAIEPCLQGSTAIAPGDGKTAPGDGRAAPGTLAAAVAVVKIALGRDHPDAAAGLDEVEAGAPELAAALATVLRLGGFLPAEQDPAAPAAEATPGKPVADPSSTGPRSTPA